MKLWQNILSIINAVGINPEDSEEQRLQKLILLITTILITLAGVIWGFFYFLFDEMIPALIPLSYSLLSVVNIAVLRISRSFKNFRFIQLLLTLLLPVLVMLALGGFINGSVVILWGLLAPVGALLCGGSRQAVNWFLSYFALIVLSAIIQPNLRTENNLPHGVILTFFVVNIGAVSTVIFLVLNYFVYLNILKKRVLSELSAIKGEQS